MSALVLRYLQTRIRSTKDGRQLRHGDVTPRKYSTLLQLTSIGTGRALCVGTLLLVGQVAKDVSGSAVIISVLIATVVHILCIQCHAELRSHFPRFQASLYQYLFQSVGEFIAFLVAWAEIAVGLLFSSSVWRIVSANIDLMSGRVISNLTSSFNQAHPQMLDVVDPLACLLGIICIIYLTLGGHTGPHLLFYHVTNVAVGISLVFTFILAAFHINPELWQAKQVFQVQYNEILRGAAILLPVLLSQRQLLVSCDFMWLGIKPTLLRSLVLSGVAFFIAHLGMACTLTLLSPPFSWTGDGTVVEAFEHVGVTWVKFVLGPVICLLLTAYGVQYMLGAFNSVQALCNDKLLPNCQFQHPSICKLQQPAAVILLGLLTALIALLLHPNIILQTAAALVLVETICITSVTLVLRYMPPQHIATICENNNCSQPETTSLIEAPDTINLTQETYGALPRRMVRMGEKVDADEDEGEDDDVDRVVEEYRLEHATRCHYSVVHTKPSMSTYQWARIATIVFLIFALASALIVQHHLKDLQTVQPLHVTMLVLCLLCTFAAVLVLILKPTDRILPRTFLLKMPSVPAIPLLTMATVTWLLSTLEVMEGLIATGWLLLGAVVYLVQILRQRDAQYNDCQLPTSPFRSSGVRPLHCSAEQNHNDHSSEPNSPNELDSQLLATFVTHQNGPGDDALILENGNQNNSDRDMLVQR